MTLEQQQERIDELRHKILAICLNTKTCSEICKILKATERTIYSHLKELCEYKNLNRIEVPRGKQIRVYFQTINLDYKRVSYIRKSKKDESPIGHFVHRIENYEAQHLAQSKKNRENRKSARTHVGISSVYEG